MTPRLTHFAINTDDVEGTQTFYGSVFGWEFQEYGPPGFVQIIDETSQTPMGAIQQRKILMEKFTIPNVGHLIAFQDPGGNPALAMEYNSAAE